MYFQRPCHWFPILLALIVGIILDVILYYVASAALPVLLWIGLGLAGIALILVFYMVTRSGNSAPTPIARCLLDAGNFLIASIVGTILTAGIALALPALLAAGAGSLPMLALVFLFGFFLGGLLGALLVLLLRVLAVTRALLAGNTADGTPPPASRPASYTAIPYR